MLGAPTFLDEEIEDRTKDPGVAVGLAWTPAGGEVLFIEASRMQGGGSLTLTGHLGDVMKESARTALSWFRANAPRYGVDPAFYKDSEIHLHVPSGAIPKDGPSAGVTMVTALASELTGRRVRGDLAMTGEITLSGRVLPVGGIKEKVLAARRHGITEVILPRQNEKNIKEDLTEELRRELTIHYVVHIEEVLAIALMPSVGADPHRHADGRRDPVSADVAQLTTLIDRLADSRLTADSTSCTRQISVSPATVFMSTISPRRIMSRASASVNVRGSMSSSSSCVAASRRRRQARQPEEEHLLVAEARRRVERRQPDDGVRHLADLLVALAPRRRLRLFSLVDAAGRQLPQPAVDRVAVLPDQDDVPRLRHRQQHDRSRDGARRPRSPRGRSAAARGRGRRRRPCRRRCARSRGFLVRTCEPLR